MVLTKKEAGNLDGTDYLLTYLRVHISTVHAESIIKANRC